MNRRRPGGYRRGEQPSNRGKMSRKRTARPNAARKPNRGKMSPTEKFELKREFRTNMGRPGRPVRKPTRNPLGHPRMNPRTRKTRNRKRDVNL